jgi:cytochrome c oxidase subunit III
MEIVSTEQRNKVHPVKFTLWVAIAAIIMMFAGLTSAYIVKSGQPNWEEVQTPNEFWYSTIAILLSSLMIQMALRSFKQRNMPAYRNLLLLSIILGTAFVIFQWLGFQWLWENGVIFKNGSGAGQFLYIIAGLHAIHLLGGIIAMLVLWFRAYLGSVKNYNAVPVEIAATYWHFVDILWIYLLVFFVWIG